MLKFLKECFTVSECDEKVEYVIHDIREFSYKLDRLDYMVKFRFSESRINDLSEDIVYVIACIRSQLIYLRELDRKSPYTTETQNRRKHLTTLTNQFIEESKYCNMTRK